MESRRVMEAMQLLRTEAKPRKFAQSVEMAINFKDVDFKKPQNRVNVDVTLPHATGKGGESKVMVFARDKGFIEQLKAENIPHMPEAKLSTLSKKDGEKLAADYDAFVAEGPVMLTVAKHLGQILAPKQKMPKPIGPSLEEFERVTAGLASSVKVTNNKGKYMPVVQLMIGNEKNSDEELTENALAVYNAIVPALERKAQNVKNIYFKLTMSSPVVIGQRGVYSRKKQREESKAAEAKHRAKLEAEGRLKPAKKKEKKPAAEKTEAAETNASAKKKAAEATDASEKTEVTDAAEKTASTQPIQKGAKGKGKGAAEMKAKGRDDAETVEAGSA